MGPKTCLLVLGDRASNHRNVDQASDEPVIPLDYVIALSAGARKLTDFISDRLFVQMTVKQAYGLG